MVVNKLQRGVSWDSYTRAIADSNNSNANNTDWSFGDRLNGNDIFPFTERLVEWRNTFNMRQITLENITESVSENSGGNKISIKATKMHGRNVVNAAKSLDLLRQNVQSAINNDIDRVIKKYLDMYFAPAINNIKMNLGHGSVNEEHIRELCRTMLDEAKHLYLNSPLSRSDSPFNAPTDTDTLIDSRFGNSQDDVDEDMRLSMSTKRRDTVDGASVGVGLLSPLMANKQQKSNINIVSSVLKNDPCRITPRTLFILSSRVTKVLGYGGMRGRLFLTHPELFRYCADTEDCEWLTKHKLIYASQLHQINSAPFLLIVDDVLELLNLECYRNKASVMRGELKGFEVPEFMRKKMLVAIAAGKGLTIPHQLTSENKTNGTTVGNVGCPSADVHSTSENVKMETNSMNGVIQATNVLIQVKEKKKIPKSNWTEDAMQKALRLISRGRSQRYVERKFGIPRRTLRNRLKIAAISRKTNMVS